MKLLKGNKMVESKWVSMIKCNINGNSKKQGYAYGQEIHWKVWNWLEGFCKVRDKYNDPYHGSLNEMECE